MALPIDARSPVVSSLSESLSGLDTIRAFGLQESFVKDHNDKARCLPAHRWCKCTQTCSPIHIQRPACVLQVNRTFAAFLHYQLCGELVKYSGI